MKSKEMKQLNEYYKIISSFLYRVFCHDSYKLDRDIKECEERNRQFRKPWTEKELKELSEIPKFLFDGNTIQWINAPYVVRKLNYSKY